MANTKEFFLAVTERVFSNWTALKLAVEHGMGPKQKAQDFPQYITEVMYMNERLDSGDIAAQLEDYMDLEFRTELEDNSPAQVAEELLRFYRYCMEGNEALATAEFEKLPPLQPWISMRSLQTIKENRIDSESENDSTDDDGGEEKMEDADPGWTEVTTRRKK